jgi:hypothetical protein
LEWLLQGGNAQYSISQNDGKAKQLRLKRIFSMPQQPGKRPNGVSAIGKAKWYVVAQIAWLARRERLSSTAIFRLGWLRRLDETPEKPL